MDRPAQAPGAGDRSEPLRRRPSEREAGRWLGKDKFFDNQNPFGSVLMKPLGRDRFRESMSTYRRWPNRLAAQRVSSWPRIELCAGAHRTLRGRVSDSARLSGLSASKSARV